MIISGGEVLRNLVWVLLLVSVWAASSTATRSQDYENLLRDFSSTNLTQTDKRFLQAALAFEGHYKGLLDGDWGRLSRNAMSDYSRSEFGTSTEEWHVGVLAISFFERYERDGWNIRYFPGLKMSVMLPEKTLINDPATESFINFRHAGSSLSISIGVHDRDTAQSLHNFTQQSHGQSADPYSVRKPSVAISSATRRDGTTLYTRSNYIDGLWSTIMLSAGSRDAHILNAVSTSIAVGRTPPLDIAANGRLQETIRNTVAAVESFEETERQAKQNKDTGNSSSVSEPDNRGGAGSGFVVSSDGHILTNAHVVDGCRSISVDGESANLLVSSDTFDLAILKIASDDRKTVAVFSNSPAKLNSDVTAVGYPYAGLLGGLNVTRGSVSSLKGLGGDATTMQITAPIQSGNSGGPLLGSSGKIVGVVVSKLDAIRLAEISGDLPQNVNYAVRGEIAKLFLAQNGIDPVLSSNDKSIKPEQLAETASEFTAFIECH